MKKYTVTEIVDVNGNKQWNIVRPDDSVVRSFDIKSDACEIVDEFNNAYINEKVTKIN